MVTEAVATISRNRQGVVFYVLGFCFFGLNFFFGW